MLLLIMLPFELLLLKVIFFLSATIMTSNPNSAYPGFNFEISELKNFFSLARGSSSIGI